jgi:hypothetical protein
LALGLKVDIDMLTPALYQALAAGAVDLNDPANTLALIEARAVIGVTAFKHGNQVTNDSQIFLIPCKPHRRDTRRK